MKNTILLYLILFALLTLPACGNAYYDEGFEDGYADGYADGYFDAEYEIGSLAEEEYEDGYDNGYYDGHHDGYREGSKEGWIDNAEDIGWYFGERAVDYAASNSKWHPEEAWGVIEAYQNNEAFYEDGSPPSKQDYLDAIDSLICFYEYFYGAHYLD